MPSFALHPQSTYLVEIIEFWFPRLFRFLPVLADFGEFYHTDSHTANPSTTN